MTDLIQQFYNLLGFTGASYQLVGAIIVGMLIFFCILTIFSVIKGIFTKIF